MHGNAIGGSAVERLRILTAAAALGEFTVGQLAAYSGINENTVRSVLRRDADFFCESPAGRTTTTDDGRARTGRPPRLWKVKDAAAVRHLIQEQELAVAALAGDAPAPYAGLSQSPVGDPRTPLAVAERALARAWRSADAELRAVFLTTVRETVHESRFESADPAARRHALVLGRLADFVDRPIHRGLVTSKELEAAAGSVAELASVAGPERAWPLFLLFSRFSVDSSGLPPVGILTDEDASPEEVLLDIRDPHWTGEPVGDGEVVWSQKWAAPLARTGLLTGVVLPYRAGEVERLQVSLNTVANLRLRKIVVSEVADRDMLLATASAGASFVPSLHAQVLGETLMGTGGAWGPTRLRQSESRQPPWRRPSPSDTPPPHVSVPIAVPRREETRHFRYVAEQQPRRVQWGDDRPRRMPAPVQVVRVADDLEAGELIAGKPSFLNVIPVTDDHFTRGVAGELKRN
jgi:hypothetical protein